MNNSASSKNETKPHPIKKPKIPPISETKLNGSVLGISPICVYCKSSK